MATEHRHDSRQQSRFASILVEAAAFDDPRLKIAAQMLGLSFDTFFVRLQKLWSWVTARGTEVLHERIIAEMLGRSPQQVRMVFCHPVVQLADDVGDEALQLQLRTYFPKDCVVETELNTGQGRDRT